MVGFHAPPPNTYMGCIGETAAHWEYPCMRIAIKEWLGEGLKGFNFGGSSYGGSSMPFGGGIFNTLPGATYQYGLDSIVPWDNGIVLTAIKWCSNAFPEATLTLQHKEGGKWVIAEEHPALDLLTNPNPDYDQSLMWSGLILSMLTNGNAYLFVNYNMFGDPCELYYMPHYQVCPKWVRPEDYISYYEYNSGSSGQPAQKLDRKFVCQMRDGINPSNNRLGLSPLGAVLREICTDNEVSTMAAAYARQAGMPGLLISPKEEVEMDQTQRDLMRKSVHEATTGDSRFKCMLFNMPMDIDKLQWSPMEMAFDKLRALPEARVTSVLGLNSLVLGLSSGLENSTYSNYETARRAAYETCMMSMWRRFAQQLTTQLLPKFGCSPKEYRFHFDTAEVRSLSESENDKHERLREDWKAGIMKRCEARAEIALPYDESDDIYIEDLPKLTERFSETDDEDKR